jgi:hypothetical protein
MMRPSSGGRNQRERTNKDSLRRTSRSRIERSMPVRAAPQSTGLRNHLLHTPARVSGDSSTDVGIVEPRSRSGPMADWLSAREAVPMMPPADAPAMSTTTRSSMLTDLAQQLEIFARCRIGSARSRASKNAWRWPRSAVAYGALRRTSFRISLLMPCI